MTKFDNKINGNTVSADEYNNIVKAPKNLIENSGQTIDSSNTQLSKAVANYVGSANFYTDSGVADAYVLSTTGSFKAPTSLVDGLEIRFRTSNPNTGASTINVAGLGVVNIKLGNGTSDISSGFITSGSDIKLRYDASNTAFIPSNEITQATTSTTGQSLLPKQVTVINGTDTDHDIDFTAGNFNFDDGSGQAVATALTKQIDAAWVVGNNVGGLDTGTVTADATYYLFAIYNPTLTISDYLFSTSATSPTLPSGYTKKKRIASLLTDGAGDIRNGTYTFFNDGSYKFIYNMGLSVSSYSSNIPTTRQSIGVPVPEGIVVECLFLCNIQGTVANTGSKYFLISSLDKPDNLATFSNFSVQLNGQGSNENENFSSPVSEVYSNTTAQVGVRGNVSNFSVQTYLKGFIDSKL